MNVWSKILLTACLLLICAEAVSAVPSISIASSNGNTGTTVDLNVMISGASNIGSLGFVITYDPAILSVNGVSKGDLTRNSLFESNFESPGIIAIGIADTKGLNGDGSVAVISFSVSGEAGQKSALTFEAVEASDVNTFIDVPIKKADGEFSVTTASSMSSTIFGPLATIVVVMAMFLFYWRRE